MHWLVLGIGILTLSLWETTGWGQARPELREWVKEEPSLLTVSGQGEVKARPDYAILRLGVEAQEEEAAAAQEAVNTAMQRAIKQIKRLDIPDEAIQTSGLSLAPVYASQQPSREHEPVRLVGYRASNILQIRVNDLRLVGKVIDGAIKSGGNRLEGITFGLKDDLPARSRALQLAADEVRTKARILAEAMGVRLGAVHRIQEGGGVVQPQMVAFARRAYADVASTPIEPGEMRVEATVTADYKIEPAGSEAKR